MAYISYQQYSTLYGQPLISEDDFAVYAAQASDMIDLLTEQRIQQAGGITVLPAWIASLVEKATAAQVVYFIQQGGLESVQSGQAGQGYSVGKVRLDAAGAASSLSAAALMISPMARALLEQTGLMYRGVPCLGPFPVLY